MTAHVTQPGTPPPTHAADSRGLGLAIGISLAAACLWVLATFAGIRVSVWLTPRPVTIVNARLAALPAGPMLDVDTATHGRDVFERTCATCHGSSGLGKTGLGVDLVRSAFVADSPDAALVEFIEKGRAVDDPQNKTRVAMPPRGGNESLTTEDLHAVAAYIRGLQDPRRLPDLPAYVPAPVVVSVSESEKQAALAAAGGDAELAGYIASGDKLFHSTCVSCHGKAGVGVKGNGKALADNEFVQSLDDDGLLAFIRQGRSPTDPKNTTGIQMPPKGGNPALSDDDILDIIAYLRTLQKGAAGATSAASDK
jgi:disulfide bond formation protein DsbB